MRRLASHLMARPRLLGSIGAGLAAALFVPDVRSPVTRALVGWNVGVWLFLALIAAMMIRADHERLKRVAAAQAEGAAVVLAVVVAAALASLVAIMVELSAAKAPGARHAVSHALFALATVASSWVLLPTLFTLNYASLFYAGAGAADEGGMRFPEADANFRPDYSDFAYFAFTIAVASQTSDVTVTTRQMRRLVLLQSVLSFVFNTTILAFTINIAASLF